MTITTALAIGVLVVSFLAALFSIPFVFTE